MSLPTHYSLICLATCSVLPGVSQSPCLKVLVSVLVQQLPVTGLSHFCEILSHAQSSPSPVETPHFPGRLWLFRAAVHVQSKKEAHISTLPQPFHNLHAGNCLRG